TVRIWDAHSFKRVGILYQKTMVSSVAYSHDGRKIVTGSSPDDDVESATDRADGNIAHIWDAETFTQTGMLKGHTDRVMCASFSPDDKRIVTASGDKSVRIWDAATGETLAVVANRPGQAGHDGLVMTAFYSHDGKRIVTASADKTARIWDAN